MRETTGTKVVFSQETYSDILEEYEVILKEHYPSLDWSEGKIDHDVDVEKYALLTKTGNLGIFTARKDGVLVGYCSVIADYHLHHKGLLFASTDSFYLKKEYRVGRTGIMFLDYVKDRLKELGVDVFSIQSRALYKTDKLLKRLGFTEVETVFAKILKEEA